MAEKPAARTCSLGVEGDEGGKTMYETPGRFRRLRISAVAAACLLLFAAAESVGETAAADEGGAKEKVELLQKQAVDLVKRMSKHLGNTKTMSFTSHGLLEVPEASGIKELRGRTAKVVLQRPDRFYASAQDDDGIESEVWFDGKSFTLLYSGPAGARYATVAAPEGARSIDGIQDHMVEKYGFVLQIGDLFYSDVWSSTKSALLSAVYLGPKIVRGRSCHHLSLEFDGVDAQLWVEDGDDPVPCRWAFTLLDETSEPLFVTDFDSWVDNPSVDAARFRFVAPAGAKKLEMKDLKAWAKAQ
jgi:hypothetical protein